MTGTNGKSTTTRMTAAALATLGLVATNAEGANMDAGLVAALAGARRAGWPRWKSTRCTSRTSWMQLKPPSPSC